MSRKAPLNYSSEFKPDETFNYFGFPPAFFVENEHGIRKMINNIIYYMYFMCNQFGE